MARRGRDAAEQAAQAASEAARVLQQRGQEAKAEAAAAAQAETAPEPGSADRAEIRQITPRNEPRRRALEDIRAREARQRGDPDAPPENKEPVAENQPPPTPEQMLQGSKTSQPEPEVPAPEKAAEPQTATAEAPAAPVMVKVKIDGEEEEVAQSVIDDAGGLVPYRINRAAEKRFAKLKADMAEERRAMAAAAAKPPEPEKPQISDKEFIASKLDEIRFGTPEQGAAALEEILKRSTPKPLDYDAVTARTMAHMSYNAAEAKFSTENADLLSNPLLAKLVNVMKNEAVLKHVQNGTPNYASMAAVDWPQIFTTIGVQVRSVAGRQSQQAPAPAATTTGNPSQGQSEKEARKASIVNLPAAAARAELPKDSKPETREDSLNRMKRARGQPIG